jgi:hypothetical protein
VDVRILLAVLAPSLFVLTELASAQVACVRGPNGAVVCGPPAPRSDIARQRGPARELDHRPPTPRYANRGGREDYGEPPRSRHDLRAPQESELDRARAARRFYSERLREAMLHEQELQQGRRYPQERGTSADRRPPRGVAPGYAPRYSDRAPPQYADRPPPRYADRAPPRYADRAPPQYRDDRREPFPPRGIQRHPPQERMGAPRLSEREPLQRHSARTPPRSRPVHAPGPPPGYRGPPGAPAAGGPAMSREEALERLRRQYNLGPPPGQPPGGQPPAGVGPTGPSPFGPPPSSMGGSQASPFGPPPQFPAQQAPSHGT